MKKTLLLFLALSFSTGAFAGPVDSSKLSPKEIKSLKSYMQKFGIEVAGLEVLKQKEKNPDWESIRSSLFEIKKALVGIQNSDSKDLYKKYTDEVQTYLDEMEKYSERKNRKVYSSIDKISQACFKCHAEHRPADFMKNK